MLFVVNVASNNEIGIAPRGRAAFLEHAMEHGCELRTNTQDCAWYANLKKAQLIDLN